MANDGILLESGTNEVEILEFVLDGQPFGVNVLKIQAIEQFDPSRVTNIQLAHPSVVGTLLFRDSCITLVDLTREMQDEVQSSREQEIAAAVDEVVDEDLVVTEDDAPEIEDYDASNDEAAQKSRSEREAVNNKLVLVMEFNDLKTAFLVDGVNRIHRISWEAINPMSAFLSSSDSKFTGSMNIEGREILIVDMEKVVTEILPKGQLQDEVESDPTHPNYEARAALRIYLAEDSAVIREKVESELARGNYLQVESFANGQECYDRVMNLHQQAQSAGVPVGDYLGAVISDIEMPQMDGLALCRNIKESLQIKDVPVIMFSSLINDQIAMKCDDVGADAYISKPKFAELVGLLDEHCLNNTKVGC